MMGWSVPNWRPMMLGLLKHYRPPIFRFRMTGWHDDPTKWKWLLNCRSLLDIMDVITRPGATRGITHCTQRGGSSPHFWRMIPLDHSISYTMFLWSWIEKPSVSIIKYHQPALAIYLILSYFVIFCPEMSSHLVIFSSSWWMENASPFVRQTHAIPPVVATEKEGSLPTKRGFFSTNKSRK